ncbi:MAG: RraA family protein [Paenibacillaceae bacterium]|nr:RraA family protein [Paenibacillaceae bacterium]
MTVTRKLVQQLQEFPTPAVADAASYLGYSPGYANSSLRCMTPGLPVMVGEAVTIKVCSTNPAGSGNMDMFWDMLAVMSRSDVPKICVIEAVEHDNRAGAVCGDGMAKIFLTVGCIGLLSSGAVRDVAGITAQGFKLFGSGSAAFHDPYEWSGLGEPVTIGGMKVQTGDLIHADLDGCIVVPAVSFDRIVPATRLLLDFEKKVHLIHRREDLSFDDKKEHAARMVAALECDIGDCGERDY